MLRCVAVPSVETGDARCDEGCGKKHVKAQRQYSQCFHNCARIFNDIQDEEKTWILHTWTQVLLNRMKKTRSAHRLHLSWECRWPAKGQLLPRHLTQKKRVVVRVRDRSDSVSDMEPATWRPRYGGSQSSSERIGPLATLPFVPTVVDAALAMHEETTQSQSLQQQQQLFTSVGLAEPAGASNTTRLKLELLQYFADFHVNQETSSRLTSPTCSQCPQVCVTRLASMTWRKRSLKANESNGSFSWYNPRKASLVFNRVAGNDTSVNSRGGLRLDPCGRVCLHSQTRDLHEPRAALNSHLRLGVIDVKGC